MCVELLTFKNQLDIAHNQRTNESLLSLLLKANARKKVFFSDSDYLHDEFFSMKKLKIEKTKPTFVVKTFKVVY